MRGTASAVFFFDFSGEDSLASNTAGAFLPSVRYVPARCAAFWFPVS